MAKKQAEESNILEDAIDAITGIFDGSIFDGDDEKPKGKRNARADRNDDDEPDDDGDDDSDDDGDGDDDEKKARAPAEGRTAKREPQEFIFKFEGAEPRNSRGRPKGSSGAGKANKGTEGAK